MKTTYRTDIEGLRAIAILAVVACHAKLPYFEGGFVGVDIFFVLSGYLITGLLVKEISEASTVNFLSFYARRFKRLLPGLALMVLASSLIASVVFSPSEQSFHAFSGQAALLWLSNFYFAFFDFGYFDAGVSGNIFLHTWSLSVEEQFYLVWPALILLFVRGNILRWMVVNFAICLTLSIYLSYAAPLWGFYSMPSRGWQFALGGIAGILATTGLPSKYYLAHARTLAGISGIILILTSILLIDEQMTYPGFAALAPSMGAALILLAKDSQVSRALSAYPLQAIGKISYSWYLWHWPVLIIGGLVFNRQDVAFQLLLVGASLALACIAYLAVENPIRRGGFRPRSVLAASVAVMFAGVLLGFGWVNKSLTWARSDQVVVHQATKLDMPSIYALGCDSWHAGAEIKPCEFSAANTNKTVVLVGDSVTAQWFSAFLEIYGFANWKLIVLTKSACPMVDESIYYAKVGGIYSVCDEWRQSVISYIEGLKPDLVFMGSDAAYDLKDWSSGTRRILAPLSAAAGNVYIIRGTPRLPFNGLDCLARHDWQPAAIAALSECSAIASSDPDARVLSALQEAAGGFDNVKILDFNELVCPGGTCKSRNGDIIVYRDNTHITDTFVKSISKQVSDIIDQAQ